MARTVRNDTLTTPEPEAQATPTPAPEAPDAAAPSEPEALIPALPKDFKFAINENVVLPEVPRAQRTSTHPWVPLFPNMGHNSSFFVPVAYWITERGRTLDTTPFSWQKNTLSLGFTDYKKKGTPAEVEAKKKWRLVTVARELGQDAEFPQFAGVRAWKVDTTR
jgi:hypothetical protein